MTDINVELDEGEHLVSDADEVCFRQITPPLLKDGNSVASHAFGPSDADKGKPSYSRSSVVSAQEARDWHSRYASKPSEAVYGISVGEVIESSSLVVDDSLCCLPDGAVRAPGHCFVDFRNLSKPEKNILRAKLLMFALNRGEIPTDPPSPADALL